MKSISRPYIFFINLQSHPNGLYWGHQIRMDPHPSQQHGNSLFTIEIYPHFNVDRKQGKCRSNFFFEPIVWQTNQRIITNFIRVSITVWLTSCLFDWFRFRMFDCIVQNNLSSQHHRSRFHLTYFVLNCPVVNRIKPLRS